MHGKIVSYQGATGRGVITTMAKKLFEFNKTSWHDKRVVPAVGMFVEFRADTNFVSDVHASRFQIFDEQSVVSEHDFWYTENDEELAEIEETKRFEYIQDIYKKTDYDSIQEIQSLITVADSVKNYFFTENSSVAAIDNLAQDDHMILIDYLYLKRFIFKALDTLLFSDKTINRDRFAEYLAILTRLENSYEAMVKYQNLNTEYIFEHSFLRLQFHYQALCSAIENHKDKLSLAKKQEKGYAFQVNSLLGRIENNRGDIEENKAKLEKIQNLLQTSIKEREHAATNLERLQEIKQTFYENNLKSFKLVFQTAFNRFFRRIKDGLNHCGSLLDDQIWRLSANSVALKKAHFKNGAEENYCAVNFALQYLSRLNKNMLHNHDQELWSYCNPFQKQHRSYILIVSSNIDLTTEVKLNALVRKKYLLVKHAPKLINLQSLLRDFNFTTIYVDKDIDWASVDDIIKEIKSFKNNASTTIEEIDANEVLKTTRR